MLNENYSKEDILAYDALRDYLCSTISDDRASYRAALKSVHSLTKNNVLNADIEQALINDCTTFYISTLVGAGLMKGFARSFDKTLRSIFRWK